MVEEDIPPGWRFNPCAWRERWPLVALSALGCVIAVYLSLYQFGALDRVFDPFFGPESSRAILDSKLSQWLPIPDALIGAIAYFLEILTEVIGGERRWKTMPWMVMCFAGLAGAMALGSMALVILQPVAFGHWCFLCLCSAVISFTLVGPAMTELLPTLQHLRRIRDRYGARQAWRGVWGVEVEDVVEVSQRGHRGVDHRLAGGARV